MKTFFASVCLLVALTGCSGGGATVVGKVTLDDGSAAPRGAVSLNSDAGSYRGAIGSDGTYTIEGVPSGDYTVVVTGVMDGEPVDSMAGMSYNEETGEYSEANASAEPKSLIDAKYSNTASSGLTLTVPGDYDLKLDGAGSGGESS